jgi:ribosome-associated heat shock protein Hsp15
LSAEKLRLDKWLWFARFCKTRSLAQDLAESGQVKLNGQPVKKAAQTVKPGDELDLIQGPYRRFITVREMGTRRGPAPEAQQLYEERRPAERLGGFVSEFRTLGSGRPTKQERRALEKLKGLD